MFGEEDDREGGTKMTPEQKTIMVEFMEDHPDFAKGKLLGNDGKQNRKAMWDILTTQLNSVIGPKKTSHKWQRVWIDLKNKVKKKASAIKKSMGQTGGGPHLKTTLTDIEIKIIIIIGEAAVYGLESTQEAPLDSEDVNQLDPEQPSTSHMTHHEITLQARTSHVTQHNVSPQPSTSRVAQPQLSSSPEVMSAESDIDACVEDHTYSSLGEKKLKKRKISQRQSSPTKTIKTSSSCSSSVQDTPRRRKMQQPTIAAQASRRFAEIGETLNSRMESIDSKLDVLIAEKKESNKILKCLVAAIEH
ncbi:uncharacterized protein LOC116171854 [Photinus pyralis]|uniref:uncharacterized protein LOC116171854 n=1 Tax=Photinus pyralis TaxID=7054 RepID=UPI00126702BE|nr:uncharacterized protein LOC116171854 [Photinus pyralis]